MPIVAEVGADIQDYLEMGLERCVPRPESCSYCAACGQMIGHGYYWRKPKDLDRAWWISVRRWKCKVCGKTVGAVPSFLLFFRHYLLYVIEYTLVMRYEQGYTWAEIQESCTDGGGPALRTVQRWGAELEEQAPAWLAAVEQTLAEQDSRSAWLDPQGEAGQVRSPAHALLRASLHLLAWAMGHWREMASFGFNDRLRFLWYWGNWRAGLHRLA